MQLVAETESGTHELSWRYADSPTRFRGDVSQWDWWAILGPDPGLILAFG